MKNETGSIDMTFENSDGTLQIYDWKRCEEIRHEPEFAKSCIDHLQIQFLALCITIKCL